jgi:hypothetical protein
VGPEQVLSAIGSGIAAVLARWLRVRVPSLVDTWHCQRRWGGFFPCLLGGAVVFTK